MAVSHPCVSCGKHHFGKPGVTCYWCEGGQQPADSAEGSAGPLTTDQLREQLDRERELKRRGAR